jgi:hypothetical protein
MDELAQVITDGLARAGAKMADEVREIAGDTAPKYANFAHIALYALGEQIMGVYRHRIMVGRDTTVCPPEVEQACERLAKLVDRECKHAFEAVKHRWSRVSNHTGVSARDININTSGPVAVAGGSVVQHVVGFDIGALNAVLTQVKQIIEVAYLDDDQRHVVQGDIATIEALAYQPKPDANALKHMAKRLAGLLKDVGVSVAAGVMEAYIKAHLGLP